MKILLIFPVEASPSFGGKLFVSEPLGLESVAATLSNHDIELLDCRLETDWKQKLGAALESFQPHLVGMSSLALTVPQVLKSATIIRNYDPEIIIVVGGKHPTFMPSDFDHPSIDIVVLGEGDYSFKAIADHLEKVGNKRDLFENIGLVEGIAYRTNGKLQFTSHRERIKDLDSLPFPNRQIAKKYQHDYSYMGLGSLACTETSRGCPNRCDFCSVWRFNEGEYRCMSARRAVDELHHMGEQDFIFMTDDNLFANIPRVKTIAKLIGKEKIESKYIIQAQSEAVIRYPDVFENWADIGLWGVFIGFESVSEIGMKGLGSNKDTKHNYNAAKVLADIGIRVFGSFIVSPDFTRRDFDDLGAHVDEMNIALPYYYILTPYPGTKLFDRLNGTFSIEEYRFFDGFHTVLPTRLPLKIFYKEYARLFERFWRNNKASLLTAGSIKSKALWYKQLLRLWDDHNH